MVRGEQRAPVRGDVVGALDLDPPPAVEEEAEQRLDEVREVLVEAPLVVGLVALEPAQHVVDGGARVPRQRRGAARERLRQLEPGLQALAQAPHEADRREVAHAATQSATASAVV